MTVTNKLITTIKLGLACSLAFSSISHSADYRSIIPLKVILYDAPSVEASKLYLLGQGYPVEIIVNLGAWLKVRDAQGGLSWVESKQLSSKKMALVLSKTDIKIADDVSASLLATVEKDVLLEVLASSNKAGWVKVKHRDGIVGFVALAALWGAN